MIRSQGKENIKTVLKKKWKQIMKLKRWKYFANKFTNPWRSGYVNRERGKKYLPTLRKKKKNAILIGS